MPRNPPKVLKRPRCGYTFFCKDEWRNVSNELRTSNSKEIIPVLAARWNNLGPVEKSRYQERAQKEKKEFEERKKQRMEGHQNVAHPVNPPPARDAICAIQ